MKYFILSLIFIKCTVFLFGQNKKAGVDSTTIFEINPYASDKIYSCQKFGSYVKFKINNVNPFKIEGSTTVVKNSHQFNESGQFADIPARSSTIENGLNEEIKSKQDSVNAKKGILNALMQAKAKVPTDKIQKEIKALNDEINLLKKMADEKKITANLQNDFINNYNCFIKALNQLSVYTSIEEYIDSLLQETFVPNSKVLKENLTLFMKSINDDENDITLLRSKCKLVLENLTNCYINAKTAYQELAKQVKNENVKLTGQLVSKEKDVEIKIDSAFVSFELKKKFEKEFQFITSKFDVINTEAKKKEILHKTSTGVYLYDQVINSDFSAYTDAQQLDDDMVTITPQLKNRKGEVLKEFNPAKITTHGGIKVDFSSGYLLSFRGDENYTNLYDTSGIIGVQKNGTDYLQHSVGALIHVYKRSCKPINLGGSFGISIPTDGTRIGFYAGLSALMLEKHRLIITGGLSYIKSKIINTANVIKDEAQQKLTGKETYLFANGDYREIKYDDLYRPAFFFGLTYNIFSIKK